MKSVGIITFHASHNCGSMLQAYALQHTVTGMGYECEIINLRTDKQKKGYQMFFIKGDWKQVATAIMYPGLVLGDIRKHIRFEKFLKQRYHLTKREYVDSEALRQNPPSFDYYISGSDQIWNTGCFDFEDAYYLDFVRSGKRIAYAPSMGPYCDEDVTTEFFDFIKENVNRYDSVSVRESGTAHHLKKIVGIEYPVMLDPTFLLDKSEWIALSGNVPKVRGQYILLYVPWYDDEVSQQAYRLSRMTGLKVVCTLPIARRKWSGCNFKFVTDVGPVEFLNLIRNASFVVSGSFHALVFSLIFNRPVYAVNGMSDSRVSHILTLTGTQWLAEFPQVITSSYDYKVAWQKIQPEIKVSMDYLQRALEL